MNLELDGNIAIVTGASKGIGRAIADKLAEEGCYVALSARTAREVEQAAEEISREEGQAIAIPGDVRDPDYCEELVEATVDRWGTVDIVVNNVGILGSDKVFHEIPDEEWDDVFSVNVMATVRVTRAALPYMREQESGAIINIASDSGLQPDDFKTHYDASKAAVINMTKNLSNTYGPEGIRVNALSPTTITTPLVEEMFATRSEETGKSVEQVEADFLEEDRPGIVTGRLGDPEDVANVVTFLASEKTALVHGSNWRIDGGNVWTMDS